MNNDGKELEHLVRLIEKSISPDSVVEHDVDLPVIGSESGRTRQCDVVIRSGQKPRETITIVEVQDRTSKTEINDFEGWLGKLKDVGAQHLICVSRHEFPTSIKETAAKEGGTVRLITLKELNAESIPVNMNITFTHNEFSVREFSMKCGLSEEEVEKSGIKDAVDKKLIGAHASDTNELCWSLDRNELISLNHLCRISISRPEGAKEGQGKLLFNRKDGPALYMFLDGHFFTVSVDCDISWTVEEMEIPLSVFSYEQNQDGVLAWIADFSYESTNGLVSTKIPLIEDGDGYRIDGMMVRLPPNSALTFEVRRK